MRAVVRTVVFLASTILLFTLLVVDPEQVGDLLGHVAGGGACGGLHRAPNTRLPQRVKSTCKESERSETKNMASFFVFKIFGA